ncbi:MAG: hypothetical protein ACLGIA_04305 [Actinomycetes bacterium]
MTAPEQPPRLGPFRALGNRHESEAGSVLAGEGPDGRPVDLVRLGLGPSSDPAARDRFRASVAGLEARSPGSVLAADLDAPLPWVAIAPGAADSAGTPAAATGATAGGLLAAAFPPGLAALPARGPQFSPYWRGRRPAGPLGASALEAAPTVRWGRWALVAFVLLVLLLLLLWWLLTRPVVPVPQPTPTPSPSPPPTVPLLPPLPPPTPFPGVPSPFPSGTAPDVSVLLGSGPAAQQPESLVIM